MGGQNETFFSFVRNSRLYEDNGLDNDNKLVDTI
jgi:hypothetical protein